MWKTAKLQMFFCEERKACNVIIHYCSGDPKNLEGTSTHPRNDILMTLKAPQESDRIEQHIKFGSLGKHLGRSYSGQKMPEAEEIFCSFSHV